MNGFAALRAIRHPFALRDTPVICDERQRAGDGAILRYAHRRRRFHEETFSRYEIFFRIERLLDDHRFPAASPRLIIRASPSANNA